MERERRTALISSSRLTDLLEKEEDDCPKGEVFPNVLVAALLENTLEVPDF